MGSILAGSGPNAVAAGGYGCPGGELGGEGIGSQDPARRMDSGTSPLGLGHILRSMPPTITWPQALAWRLRRHFLNPVGSGSIAAVVRRLCGVQAQVPSSAELAVAVRRNRSRVGGVARALSQGRLVKTWAMRGTLHLLTPEDAGVFLSLMAAGRSWERPSWQRYFGVGPEEIETLRRVVREELAAGPLTREELVKSVTARRGLGYIGEGLRSGWGTLLKPLAWQGDLCFGPNRGTRVTFTLPENASNQWSGVPHPDQAAPEAIAAYVGAYGPATMEAFAGWLAGGWFGKRQLRSWFELLGQRLAEVEVDGELSYVLVEHLDELESMQPTTTVRLLPGFDQYVLGPGTKDGRVVPPHRRNQVSRQSGWISPVVVAGGVVSGTWELDDDHLRVSHFEEAGTLSREELEVETERLASILGRELTLAVRPG